MSIKVGDRIPSHRFKYLSDSGMEEADVAELLKGKTTALFAVPGAFTPTCSAKHLPGFVERAEDLRAKGVDQIVCLSVNDPFVMRAWAKQGGAEGIVLMLPDGSAELTKKLGLDVDLGANGLGVRSKRFSMVVEDGVVKTLNVEQPGAFEASSADHMLAQL